MAARATTAPGPKRPEPPWLLAAWRGVGLGVLASGAMVLGALSARPGGGG